MAQVSITVTGLTAVRERLAGLEARAQNFAPALDLVAKLLEAQTQRVFDTQGEALGARWQPLAASTMRARQMRWGYYRATPAGAIDRILEWTWRLRRSFVAGGSDHIREVSSSTLRWGSAVPYARFLQPRRPMIGFRGDFQAREVVFQPLRLWLQGVPIGAIETVMRARTRL